MVWMCCLAYVLFQGGKTSLMLLSMVTLLCVYLAIAGFSGVRRAQGVRRLSSGPDHEDAHAGDQVQVQLSLRFRDSSRFPMLLYVKCCIGITENRGRSRKV